MAIVEPSTSHSPGSSSSSRLWRCSVAAKNADRCTAAAITAPLYGLTYVMALSGETNSSGRDGSL